MGKLSTPEWILGGYKSKEEFERKTGKKTTGKKEGKTYKVKVCPKCRNRDVSVLLGGEEGRGSRGWECKKCKWQGKTADEQEISEEEFLKLKEQKFFNILREFLTKLGFDKNDPFLIGIGRPWDEETESPILNKEENIEKYSDRIDNFFSKDYSIDVIYFSKKVVLIINIKNKNKLQIVSDLLWQFIDCIFSTKLSKKGFSLPWFQVEVPKINL